MKKKNHKFKKYITRKLRKNYFLKADIKMEKIIKFGDIKTEKQKFHQPISRTYFNKNIDIKKIASNKVCFGKKGFKYFIGCKGVKKIRPLCIFILGMTAY